MNRLSARRARLAVSLRLLLGLLLVAPALGTGSGIVAPASAAPRAAAPAPHAAPAKAENSAEAVKSDDVPSAPDQGPSPKQIRDKLTTIRAAVDAYALSPQFLSARLGEATALRTEASECQQFADEHLGRVAQAIAAIGEKQADENAELAERRRRIEARKAREENRRAECRLAVVYADSLIARIDTAQKNLLKQRLIRRGPDFWAVSLWMLEHPRTLADAVLGIAGDAVALRGTEPLIVALALLAAVGGGYAGRWARRRAAGHATIATTVSHPASL
jgi:hypothetical protein